MEQNNMFVPEWNSPVSIDRNEIVFEKKNQKYGAFALRKNYNKTILLALLITGSLVSSVSMIPLIAIWLKPAPIIEKVVKKKNKVTIKQIEKEEKKEEKPLEIPKIATVKFTEFKPSETPDKDPIFDPKDMNPGIENQDGDKNPAFIDPSLSGGIITGGGKKNGPQKYVSTEPKSSVDYQTFFENNIEYPEFEYSNGIEGVVQVSFVVNAQGKVTNVKVLTPSTPAFNKEAVRVVSLLPKFRPAIQNGSPVSFTITLPISFSIVQQ